MSTAVDPPYRYELWRLDTETLVHVRVTRQYFEPGDPVLLERGPFDGYPIGYQWRAYRRHREIARWSASALSTALLDLERHRSEGVASVTERGVGPPA